MNKVFNLVSEGIGYVLTIKDGVSSVEIFPDNPGITVDNSEFRDIIHPGPMCSLTNLNVKARFSEDKKLVEWYTGRVHNTITVGDPSEITLRNVDTGLRLSMSYLDGYVKLVTVTSGSGGELLNKTFTRPTLEDTSLYELMVKYIYTECINGETVH